MGMFDFLDPNTPGNMGASANRYGGITGASGGGSGMSGMSPYIALALQALGGGLQGAGAAQAAGARGFGAGIGPGFAGAQVMQQRQQEYLAQNRYLKAHTDEMQARAQETQRQAQADAEHQAQVERYIATLPPDQQQMARLAPKEVIAQQVQALYPDPVHPTSDMINYQYGKDHPDFLAAQEKLKRAGATNVTVGSNNGGVQMPVPMTQGTATTAQTSELNETDQLARLNQISNSFDPKWLTLAPRAGQAWNSLKEFVGLPLTEDQQKALASYTDFTRNSIENFNLALKAQTGTAVSPGEAERIKAQLPNAGTGMFDGDSPTQFKTKLEGALRSDKLALMRRHFFLKQGKNPLETGIDIADVPNLIRRRGAELEAGLKQQNPGLTPEQIQMEVKARLRDEFGS